jgi:hypothetical protein
MIKKKQKKKKKNSRRDKRQHAWPKWKANVLLKLLGSFLMMERRLFSQEELPALPRIESGLPGMCPTAGCRWQLATTVVQCIERTGELYGHGNATMTDYANTTKCFIVYESHIATLQDADHCQKYCWILDSFLVHWSEGTMHFRLKS